jgi:acetyl-CoA acetyltransferase
MADAYIIDAVRTPRSDRQEWARAPYSHMHPQHVAATVLRRDQGS